MTFWKESSIESPPPRPIVVFYPGASKDESAVFFYPFGSNEQFLKEYFLWIECDPMVSKWLDMYLDVPSDKICD